MRSGEAKTVAGKKGVVVLLRFAATTGTGDPVDLLGGIDVLDIALFQEFFLLVEDIDTGEQRKVIRPRSLTRDAAREGWVYLVLAPGRYFLRMQPYVHAPISGRFVLRVPPDHAVIYVGSLPLTCRERGWFERVFGGPSTGTVECSVPTAVVDESQVAIELGLHVLSNYPQPATVLMTAP